MRTLIATYLWWAHDCWEEARKLRNLHRVQRSLDGRVKYDNFRRKARRREIEAAKWTNLAWLAAESH